MLFEDVWVEKRDRLAPIFEKLFEIARDNQAHQSDLFLVNENGRIENVDKDSLIMIGPGKEGFSDRLHYQFIHGYRESAVWKPNSKEYRNSIGYSEKYEELTIQIEMLVYLKIWEADFFIKRLYQLGRLINGDAFDWHFNLVDNPRERMDKTTGLMKTGTRNEVISKIIESFKTRLPDFHASLLTAYQRQVRNAIAHSNYGMLQANIHLLNGDESKVETWAFEKWIDVFHETMAIYNECIGLSQKINLHYTEKATQNHGVFEVVVNRKHLSESIDAKHIKLDGDRWIWEN